jgi:hypothetical protein
MDKTGRNDPCRVAAARSTRNVVCPCTRRSSVSGRPNSRLNVTNAWPSTAQVFARRERRTPSRSSASRTMTNSRPYPMRPSSFVRAGKLDEAERAARDLLDRFPEVHDGWGDRLGRPEATTERLPTAIARSSPLLASIPTTTTPRLRTNSSSS